MRRLLSADEPAFDELVRIYSEAHALSERKSTEQLAAMIRNAGYCFLVAVESNAVVGFSIVRSFNETDAGLLEYMAVARDSRSCGIGGRLFVETLNFGGSSRFLLIEVDSDKARAADQEDRHRRKRFYRRLGCREIEGLRYIMPPVSSAAPPEMEMLVHRSELPPHIERARLRQWLERCYVEVYGMTASDPRIDAMLDGLPANVRFI